MLRDANGVLYTEVFMSLKPDMRSYLVGALEGHYNQTFRVYHNLDHIEQILSEWLEDSFPRVRYAHEEFAIAMLFHDTIYNLRAKPGENERESADVAITVGMKCFTNIDWLQVHRLIMATQHDGKLATASEEEKYMADCDLASLALMPENYFRTRERVIKEYLTMYTVPEVMMGRRIFIENMLARPKIFYTMTGYESQARANLKEELARMDAGSLPEQVLTTVGS